MYVVDFLFHKMRSPCCLAMAPLDICGPPTANTIGINHIIKSPLCKGIFFTVQNISLVGPLFKWKPPDLSFVLSYMGFITRGIYQYMFHIKHFGIRWYIPLALLKTSCPGSNIFYVIKIERYLQVREQHFILCLVLISTTWCDTSLINPMVRGMGICLAFQK